MKGFVELPIYDEGLREASERRGAFIRASDVNCVLDHPEVKGTCVVYFKLEESSLHVSMTADHVMRVFDEVV